MAARDQGLLVGRGDDLARAKGGDHRPKADHPPGADHDHVDVVTGRQGFQGVAPADPLDASREIKPGEGAWIAHGDDRRPQTGRLLRQALPIRAGRQGDDVEGIGVGEKHVDGLTTDRAG